jgi:hypothetical protein
MIRLIIGLLALIGAVLLARWLAKDRFASLDRWDPTRHLSGRAAPWVIGALTTLMCGYVWGHVHPTAVVHDEASYLLQARIFALGRFAMPAPPLPEFFEQFHTLVTPAFASKYPPGHALLLSLGALIGWAALVPLLLDGLTGALVFLLARRVANPWVALLTWFIWITAGSTYHHIASFFSQSTTCALWMLGWWALLRWRESSERRWLLALAACTGGLAITRPMTAVAYAIPVAVVVLTLVVRRRAWKDLGLAMAVGTAILLVIPYANYRATGSWREMPFSQYSKLYLPFDKPGFGLDSTPPQRALPPDMAQLATVFQPVHASYEPSMLPETLVFRIWISSQDVWFGARILLGLVALAAIPLIGIEVGFALAGTLTLYVCYLSYAHSPFWTIYYAETLPVFALLTALGLWRLFSPKRVAGSAGAHQVARGPMLATCALLLFYLPTAARNLHLWHATNVAEQSYQRAVANAVATIPESKVIVFVRYAPWHNIHKSLIANEPDLRDAHAWLVYDRGADNMRLRRLAPDRVAYIYDEARLSIERYPDAPVAMAH